MSATAAKDAVGSLVARKFSSMRSRAQKLIYRVCCWLQDLRGIEREPSPEDRDHIEALREDIARDVPPPLGLRMAEAWLTEARSIYDHRDARLARVEARATTLQGIVRGPNKMGVWVRLRWRSQIRAQPIVRNASWMSARRS